MYYEEAISQSQINEIYILLRASQTTNCLSHS